MITAEATLLGFLDAHGLPYQRIEHPPVFTCAEAALYRPLMPGLDTKNLLLRGEANNTREPNFYLVLTACEKRLDLKALGKSIGSTKLHFASGDQLMDLLGVSAGSVTVLALVNDIGHRVTLLVDAAYWPADAYLCHPMVNTATLALEHTGLMRFFDLTGHVPRVIEMPG